MTARDPLAEYNRKRDFKLTAEPAGKRASSSGGNRFIVQKHDATRLHWDLRLEADGVLKSWAVTKGPSPDPEIKRLAVRTEDHPLSYAEFEGTIPKGEYGGGTVMLWDRGTWEPVEGKSWKDIDKGHLHFTLTGERMNGEWLLIRLKPRPGEKRENWLLRKISDEFAEEGDPLVEHALTSVLTGRTMAEIEADTGGEHSLQGKKGDAFAAEMMKAAKHNAKVLPVTGRGTTRRVVEGAGPKRGVGGSKPPKFRAPQLATLVDSVPAGNRWMHEIKFDGYRALIAAAQRPLVTGVVDPVLRQVREPAVLEAELLAVAGDQLTGGLFKAAVQGGAAMLSADGFGEATLGGDGVGGVGQGLFQVGYMDTTTSLLPAHERGVAGSLVSVTRLLGIALSGEFTTFFAGALVWELGFTLAAILALRRGPRPG